MRRRNCPGTRPEGTVTVPSDSRSPVAVSTIGEITVCALDGVDASEVVGSKVLVCDLIADHEVDRGQNAVLEGADGSFLATPRPRNQKSSKVNYRRVSC